MILDPKDGVYISGTAFAIQRHVDEDSKAVQWRLLQINKMARCYELVCCHSDPWQIAIELTSYHVNRVKGNGIKSLDVYRKTVDIISRRCETAINALRPETLGGALNV
ncbi:DUF5405 family protein [Providencia rettgeri]|uniref:DUF5405 family protein n=1 Tax=Providencia rettgeri TaxID=587 RepID=UPI0018C573B0|nr:DUF5405 family protein [Providencia rettgeri]MBG5930826.1 hypothetical protein [Providencia rettgeri]